MIPLPQVALSVRQPWAWAIIHGGKDVENRSAFAVSKGSFEPKRICIHASIGMTRQEYRHARLFMLAIGVGCPRPDMLVRRAIIGVATVDEVVTESDSPWFFGPRGLVLSNVEAINSIPVSGALGYFTWTRSGKLSEPLPWMKKWK